MEDAQMHNRSRIMALLASIFTGFALCAPLTSADAYDACGFSRLNG